MSAPAPPPRRRRPRDAGRGDEGGQVRQAAAGGTAQFRVGQIIRFLAIDTNAASNEVQGHVTYVDATNDRLAFVCTKAATVAIDFDDRGSHQLKGVPHSWPVFAVRDVPA